MRAFAVVQVTHYTKNVTRKAINFLPDVLRCLLHPRARLRDVRIGRFRLHKLVMRALNGGALLYWSAT